jgi:hypothetical protein
MAVGDAFRRAYTPQQLEMLGEATEVVGDFFGSQADCADAAAWLAATAKRFGVGLKPRPVSVIAKYWPTGATTVMGPAAIGLVPESERHRLKFATPGNENNGHLILTSSNPPLLLDPNLRQLATVGIPAPSVIMRIGSEDPANGGWHFEADGVDVDYLLDEENTILLERFDEAVIGYGPQADQLAAMLARGMTADDIRPLLGKPIARK